MKLPHHYKNINLSNFEKFLLTFIFLITATEFVIALTAPPNTWDSMTYHMSRIAHWIQNQNINFYPTPILRQLHQPPWAEFAVMHFQILTNGDRFANLIQWFSMIGSIIGVTFISKILGCDRQGQTITAVVAATIPMGILQASSTQNDYAVSFWLVCMVCFFMMSEIKSHWLYIAAAGASLGLALLTKGTAYIYAFPFLISWSILQFKKFRFSFWKQAIVILGVAFLINLPHYTRNFNLYKNPLGPGQESATVFFKYTNDKFSFPVLISNVIRNTALHITTPFQRINHIIERMIYKVLGSTVNDLDSTWTGANFHINKISFHEDSTGNLFHLILIIISLNIIFFSEQMRKEKFLLNYSIVITSAFLLFCFILKWQPWHSRLHLPLFVISSPIIGRIFCINIFSKIKYFIVIILILSAFPFIFMNKSRPVFKKANIFNTSRIEQYFINRPELFASYIEATNFLKKKNV